MAREKVDWLRVQKKLLKLKTRRKTVKKHQKNAWWSLRQSKLGLLLIFVRIEVVGRVGVKGGGSQLPERPFGCFAQLTPDPFYEDPFLQNR